MWKKISKICAGIAIVAVAFYAGVLVSFSDGGLESADIQQTKNDLPSIIVNSPLGPQTYYVVTPKERQALQKVMTEQNKTFEELFKEYNHLKAITGCS